MRAIRRRWLPAAASGLALGAAAAVAGWYYYPPQYTASAVIVAAVPDPSLLDLTARAAGNKDEVEAFQRSQVALVRSARVIGEAFRRPEVRNTLPEQTLPPAVVEQKLRVGFQDGSQLLVISLSDSRAEYLAAVVNAIKDVYLKEAKEARSRQLAIRKKEVEDLVSGSEGRVLRLRNEARRLSSGPGPSTKETAFYEAAIKELARLQAELGGAVQAVAIYRERACVPDTAVAPGLAGLVGGAIYRERMPTPDAADIEQVVVQDADVIVRKRAVTEAEAALKKFQKVAQAGAKNQFAAELDDRLEEARGELVEAEERARAGALKAFRDRRRAAVLTNLTTAEGQVEILTRREAALKADVENRAPPQAPVQDEAEQKKMEVAQAEAALRVLREVLEKLSIEERTTPRNLASFQDAEPPTHPDRASFFRRVAGYGTGGLVFGLLAVGFWELLTRRIGNRDEVVTCLGLRVIGDLPHIGWAGGWLFNRRDPEECFAEAVSSLRAILILSDGGTGRRIFLVTSAVPGEGKTTLSYHLARSVARTNLKTLLIDGDLPRPRLHDLFGLPPVPGLSEILCGTATPADTVRRIGETGLYFLPAGNGGALATDALHGERARDLFRTLRGQWDVVIIDAPPVLATADPLLLGRYADAALVAVRAGVSVAPCVRAACDRLADVRVELLGVVMTGTRTRPRYYYPRSARLIAAEEALVPLTPSPDPPAVDGGAS